MDHMFLIEATTPGQEIKISMAAALTILVGTMVYGFTFGLWRAPLQGIYSAVKMPLLFFAAVISTSLINTMLAQLMGAKLSFRKVSMTVLLGMAITAALMAAIAPVVLFLVLQLPAPNASVLSLPADHPAVMSSMRIYWTVLLLHVAVIAVCGIIGNFRLHKLLCHLTGARRMASRLMIVWILVMGLAGCELSWLLSPFLCKPTQEPHIVPREYFQQNFYERVWYAINEVTRRGT
jgi:hypothetical protein